MNTKVKPVIAYHTVGEVTVVIEVNDPDVIERVTGPRGDEWRRYAYDLHTQEDVLQHLYYNAVANGVTQVNRLDGWGDLSDDACRMHVNQDITFLDVTAFEV